MSKNLRSFITILSLVFMLLAGMFTPYTAQARGQDTKSISARMMQEAASILFSDMSEEDMRAAFEFAEMVQNDSRLRRPTFSQLGKSLIDVGQGKDIQSAAADFIREQPALSEPDEDVQAIWWLIIILILVPPATAY